MFVVSCIPSTTVSVRDAVPNEKNLWNLLAETAVGFTHAEMANSVVGNPTKLIRWAAVSINVTEQPVGDVHMLDMGRDEAPDGHR